MYGFKIKSSKSSQYSEYVVITDNKKLAFEMINKEKDYLLSADDGWIWGTPIVIPLSIKEMKQLRNANLIWE